MQHRYTHTHSGTYYRMYFRVLSHPPILSLPFGPGAVMEPQTGTALAESLGSRAPTAAQQPTPNPKPPFHRAGGGSSRWRVWCKTRAHLPRPPGCNTTDAAGHTAALCCCAEVTSVTSWGGTDGRYTLLPRAAETPFSPTTQLNARLQKLCG